MKNSVAEPKFRDWVLPCLFPFVMLGSVFVAGALEERGNRVAGWLWIPFSILVMFGFGIIHFKMTRILADTEFSFPVFARIFADYLARQILVLMVLAIVAFLLALLNPFPNLGRYR